MEHLLDPTELLKFQKRIVMHHWFEAPHDETPSYPTASSLNQYARIRGWTQSQLDQLTSDPCSLGARGLAMLQSMLFFGVWESITGESMSSSNFLVGSPTHLNLNSKNLRPLIHQAIKSFGSGNSLRKSEQLCATMEEVDSWHNILLAPYPNKFSFQIFGLQRQTVLAIDALAFIHCHIPQARRLDSSFHHLNLNKGFYTTLLRDNGLCPSYYDYLQYAGTSVIEYFCVVGHIGDSSSDHLSCNTGSCLQTIAIVGDKANHIHPNCICRSISMLCTTMHQILGTSNYFVVDIIRLLDLKEPPSEAIVPFRSGLKYVAFSHVWSHGLGNIADKGLPICRLRFLRKLMRSLQATYGTITHFWIDAMCIPEDSNLKKMSIGMMDQIYRNAAVVMALDAMLQTLPFQDLSYESLAINILLSDWNRRLWTFQEAKLATALTVALNNRWISVQALHDTLWEKIDGGYGSPVTLACMQQLACLTQHTTGLFEWLPLLQFRSCSVPTDEPLVISALEGLDTSSLAQEKGEDRMAKFWSLLGRVPSGILFHASPKLRIEHYRWAPRSLICGSNETGITGARGLDSDVTQYGLRASYFTVEFGEELTLLNCMDPTIVDIRKLRLICHIRDEAIKRGAQSLTFNALAFIRDPLIHRVVLPNTRLSAVALKQTSSNTRISSYDFIAPLLVEVEEIESTEIRDAASTMSSRGSRPRDPSTKVTDFAHLTNCSPPKRIPSTENDLSDRLVQATGVYGAIASHQSDVRVKEEYTLKSPLSQNDQVAVMKTILIS